MFQPNLQQLSFVKLFVLEPHKHIPYHPSIKTLSLTNDLQEIQYYLGEGRIYLIHYSKQIGARQNDNRNVRCLYLTIYRTCVNFSLLVFTLWNMLPYFMQWSFGVTCWEIFSGGKQPYGGINPLSIPMILSQGGRMEIPANIACSEEM